MDFAYLTGWRRGKVLGLEWRDVDRVAGVIRLRPEMSKTREGRTLVLSALLRAVFDRYNIVSEGDLRQTAERLAAYVGAYGS